LGKLAGEFDDMLARAAANLGGISGFSSQISFQDTKDGLMVTVKRRRIEPSIGVATAAILAKFNDIAGHLGSPGFRCTTALSGDGLYALNDYIWITGLRELPVVRLPFIQVSRDGAHDRRDIAA
jgi:hypothetical protein